MTPLQNNATGTFLCFDLLNQVGLSDHLLGRERLHSAPLLGGDSAPASGAGRLGWTLPRPPDRARRGAWCRGVAGRGARAAARLHADRAAARRKISTACPDGAGVKMGPLHVCGADIIFAGPRAVSNVARSSAAATHAPIAHRPPVRRVVLPLRDARRSPRPARRLRLFPGPRTARRNPRAALDRARGLPAGRTAARCAAGRAASRVPRAVPLTSCPPASRPPRSSPYMRTVNA